MTNAQLVPLPRILPVTIRNPNTRAAAAVAVASAALVVWNVIEQDLPALKEKVTAILEAGPPQAS